MTTAISATAQHRRALAITLSLTFVFFLIEVVGGLMTNSLALLADAGHMLTDVGGLALALFASWISGKQTTLTKTYGYYRAEILAALANSVALFLISVYILYEAYRRFLDPPEVSSLPMLAIAVVGLGINVFGIVKLRKASKDSLNMEGAYLEVVSDALGSLGVIVAGLIMIATGWYYADPIIGVLIGLFILPRTWRLLSQAVNVLLEGTPAHINPVAVEQAILQTEGITSVHDLHVWSITSGIDALSAHVVLKKPSDSETASKIVETLTAHLKESFGIDHTTIQVEFRDLEKEETAL